jgi:hypothetical protein
MQANAVLDYQEALETALDEEGMPKPVPGEKR